MTHEEKQLLLKDLCARLPYGVVVHTDYKDIRLDRKHCGVGVLYYEHYSEEAKKECGYDDNDFSILISGCFYGNNIKPYLRPMSSMTDEEYKEYDNAIDLDVEDSSETLKENLKAKTRARVSKWYHGNDWLNAHHFDYRGLIDKGLALEAPEGMYSKN